MSEAIDRLRRENKRRDKHREARLLLRGL